MVSMVRVVIAGLIAVCVVVLGGFADQMSPLAQFATVIGALFAVSFVLPHYFYRGEPLLPERHKKKR
jgi:hypothetical protein